MELYEVVIDLCHKSRLKDWYVEIGDNTIKILQRDFERLFEIISHDTTLKTEHKTASGFVVVKSGSSSRIPILACDTLPDGLHKTYLAANVCLTTTTNNNTNANNRAVEAFKIIREASSLADGLTNTDLPFIVRAGSGSSLIKVDRKLLRESFSADKSVLSWYETPTELFNDKYNDGAKLLQEWDSDTLSYNIVDSPNNLHHLLPTELAQNVANLGKRGTDYAICYALTKNNNLTKYHVDELGDGWVYLVDGRKIWHMFSAECREHLEKAGISLFSIKDLSFTELIQLLDGYMWGKVYVSEVGPGDLIYFSRRWPHRVITYEKSFGVCGYSSTKPVLDDN
jgi:hypothetical protein